MKYNLANNEPFEINGDVYVKGKALDDLTSIPFTNPVGEWCPDPCFWKGDDGYFYIKGTGRLVTVKRTRDFVNYEDTGRIFISTEAQNKLFDLYGHYATDDSTYKLHPNYWAPFVIKIGDNWVLYQAIIERTGTKTNVVDGTAHIVAFTSKTPYGNFSNPVTIVSDNEITAAYDSNTKWNNIIDPFVYCDPFDNHIYLLAGSSYGIRRKRLSDDGLSMYKDGSTLAVDNYAMHVAGQSIKTDPSRATVYEGAYLYNKIGKWGNYWYLFVSSGSHDSRDYCVKVGRCPSTNYHIGGTTNINFQDKASRIMRAGGGTTILSTESESSNFWGPGHIGGIFETEDGKTWMLYHCHDGNGSQDRKLFIQELLWDADGWPYFENNGHPISNGRISKHIITSTNDVYCKKDITEITWSSLKSLRDAGNLVPGQQYRITDYTCTTVKDETKSAGNVFDIIVTADSESILSEEARAIQHEGDTYFANSNLSAWKIWYCLDNDNTRFEWAVPGELIDTIKSTTGISETYKYNSSISGIKFSNKVYNLEIGVKVRINGSPLVYITKTDDYTLVVEDHTSATSTTGISVYSTSPGGKGIIYRMIDEFGNDVPYDFKNIQFYRQWDSSKSLWSTISKDNTGVPCYTFSSNGNSSTTSFTDMSLRRSNNIYSNVIKIYISSSEQHLNNICFFGNSCYRNSFGDGCSSNSFGYNTFLNRFGYSCFSNIFGNSCNYNIFGNYCSYNEFGKNFSRNSFGNDCTNNIFSDYCTNNSFGNGCKNINFASDSKAGTLYNYYQNNHFGDGCKCILFKGEETASFSKNVKNYNFAQGLQGTPSAYLTVDGVRNREYETKVAKNSAGELKIYCEADLIQ